MFKKENWTAIMVSAFGGGVSMFLAGYEKAGGLIGFMCLGFFMGIAVGVLKKSVKRAIAAAAICALLSIVAMFAGSLAVFALNPHNYILKAVILGVTIGVLLGGGMGIITGYDSGEKLLLDSIETTFGGIIGGSIAMPIVYLGYKTGDSTIFTIAGIMSGIILASALIISLEIADRNELKNLDKKR